MSTALATLTGKIGLFGGSFDPVHNAHLQIAEIAIKKLGLNKIIFIPAKKNPLKKSSSFASDSDRLEMLRLALKNRPDCGYSDIEIKRQSADSYSIDTLREIKSEITDKNIELFLIIGSDQIENFDSWKDYKDLLKLAKIVVFGRQSIAPKDFHKINPELLPSELYALALNFIEFDYPVSSTQLRQDLINKNFKLAKQHLPIHVFDWIVQNSLYQ